VRHTQIRTHAHTHAARRGRRTEIRTPDAAPASAGRALENPDGGERPARALRVLRALRAARARCASESRGPLTGEARLTGSDGAPLGGSERGGARGVTSAATPPSESGTEVRGVAQPAPFPADRPFGTSAGGQRPRADGAGRMSEYGFGPRGRRGGQCARSAQCPRGRPLVIVPYLKNAPPRETLSRDDAQQVVSPCQATDHTFSRRPTPVVAGPLVAESSFLNPPEGAGRSNERWKDGGRGGCEKDAIRAGTLRCPVTCRNFEPSCTFTLNSESPELPQLLTVNEVGQRLGLCRRSVERLIASQQLRACKIGRATRIAVAELVRFVNGLHQGPTTTGGAS